MEENTTSEVVSETVIPADDTTQARTFTQDELDKAIQTRLSKSERAIYSKLGIESKNDLEGVANRLKDYDTLKSSYDALNTELTSIKAEREKAKYLNLIEKADVDDEVVEFVYSKVTPVKDESVDDYKTRLNTYLDGHKNFIKGNVSTISTSINFGGSTPQKSANQRMNDLLRGKE